MSDHWRSAKAILAIGGLVLAVSLGIRHGFGLFLQPVSEANGWGREVFGFAIAVQNLVWGIAQPFTGMLADRIGAGKVILGGAVFYAAGLCVMSLPLSAEMFVLAAGVLVGLGLSGTTFPIVFGAVSRAISPEKRSVALGIAMAVGSFGQFVLLPGSFGLNAWLGWSGAFLGLAVLAALMVPLSFGLMERPGETVGEPDAPKTLAALREAFAHRGFWLLTLGFFVCGFQVVFIAVHLPAYLGDKGVGGSVASITLALIGLVNIVGAYSAGVLGGRRSKPMLLVWIYLLRGAGIAAFVLLPVSAWSAYIFGAFMGLFWLSTVPLTNGTVASIFGVRNMSMLAGFVFFSHQLGSFAGGWLGGYLYDSTGSYDVAWGVAVGLSLLAALLHVPIRETPVVRAPAAAK